MDSDNTEFGHASMNDLVQQKESEIMKLKDDLRSIANGKWFQIYAIQKTVPGNQIVCNCFNIICYVISYRKRS